MQTCDPIIYNVILSFSLTSSPSTIINSIDLYEWTLNGPNFTPSLSVSLLIHQLIPSCLKDFFKNFYLYQHLLINHVTQIITIEVGKYPNVKIFHAHMVILYYHSPFYDENLPVKENVKLPNISPDIPDYLIPY